MRLVSFIVVSIVGGAALAADAVAVSKRPTLTGFGDIRFGMTESALQSTLPIVKSETYTTDAETTWYESAKPVEVDGAQFHINVMVERGIVRRIRAMRGAPAQNGACKVEFDAMVAYLESQYGPPDINFKRPTGGFYQAAFEFEDHAYIELNTLYFDKHAICTDMVTYYSSSAVAQ